MFRRCFYAITNKRRYVHCLRIISSDITKRIMKSAPDKSYFVLARVKFLGHIIERNTITPLKSR